MDPHVIATAGAATAVSSNYQLTPADLTDGGRLVVSALKETLTCTGVRERAPIPSADRSDTGYGSVCRQNECGRDRVAGSLRNCSAPE